MSMERWYCDTDRGKQKYSEENLSKCHFVHKIPLMDWTGIERGPPSFLTG